MHGRFAIMLVLATAMSGCAHHGDELARAQERAHVTRQEAIAARAHADKARYEADYAARWARNARRTAKAASERVELIKERRYGPAHKKSRSAKKKREHFAEW